MREWKAADPLALKVPEKRYNAIKEVGKRNLAGKGPRQQRSAAPETRADKKKIGRNDAYPCGSGKKYKKCCL